MADVAQLGLSVDSSQVKSATAALGQLNAASQTAAKGADSLAAAGAKSDTVLRAIEAAAKRSGISVAEMTARVDAANQAHQKLTVASSSAQKALVNLSAQSKQVANDNAALGKSADATTSSFDKFASRFTRGLIAGATITAVKELGSYLFNLNAQLAATADTAQRVGVGGQQFQGLQTAAAYKGVSNDSFNAAMLAFNAQVDLAKHGIGDLQTLLTSNSKTVSDTATTFGTVANLVKNAGSEAQKFSILQQAGLPATREFAKLMEQGADSITRQSLAAAKLRDSQLEDAQRLDERWQKLWTDFTQWGKKAALDVGEGMKNIPTPFAHQGTWVGAKLQSIGFDRPEDPNSARNQGLNALRSGMGTQLGANAANGIYNATGAFGTAATDKKTFDPALARQQISLEQQRLGLLSPLATAEDVVRQKQLEINAAALNNVGISKSQADALKLITLAQFEQARVQQQATIGVFDFAKAQKAANDNLQALVAQKLLDPNNPAQWAAANMVAAKSIEQLRDSALVAAAPLEGLQRLANEAGNARTQLDQFATTSVTAISPALTDMLMGTTSLADGFKNLGASIAKAATDAVIKLTIIKPLIDSLQSSLGSSGLGSFLGIGGTGTVANGGITLGGANGPTPFAAANGGTFGPGWGVVGERGPELIKVHNAGVTVIPNHISKPYLPGFAEGGSLSFAGGVSRLPLGQNNSPQFSVSVNNFGSDKATVEQEKNSSGGIDWKVMIGDAAASEMAKPGSTLRQTTDQRGRLARRG
jgi:hypothetical protein